MTRALVFDSGVGGLTIADALRKAAPDWVVDYAADSGFFPYGVKTDEELRERLPALCARLVEVAKPDVLVIACNTASTLSLDDIRARTQTSKSQLFHYFPDGKDQLLLAVAEHEAHMVLEDQQPHLGELTSWAAWRRWRDAVVDRYRRQGQHCPLAVLMSEIGRTTPGAEAVSAALVTKWHGEIATGIRDMQAQGKPAAEIAAFSSEMEAFKLQYAQPLFRMAITLSEIAPVGLLVSLVSAALLRNSRLFPSRRPA